MASFQTAAWTAVFGVVVFVAGQSLQRFILEPLQDQRKTVGDIAFALLVYGNVGQIRQLHAAGEQLVLAADPPEVVRTIRSLGGRLQQSLYTIPFYDFWAGLRLVPPKTDVLQAISHLTAWSNSIFDGQPGFHRDRIAKALRIPRPE